MLYSKPLAFHPAPFGSDVYSHSLRRMATIAGEVYNAAPGDPLAPSGPNPCSFSSALDTVSVETLWSTATCCHQVMEMIYAYYLLHWGAQRRPGRQNERVGWEINRNRPLTAEQNRVRYNGERNR
jgi:hypothetical protein